MTEDGGSSKTPRRPKTNDANIRAAETKLRRALGTQVRIVQRGDEGQGTIEISFFNQDDLDRIYTVINKNG
jgi:hypothetical protein